MSFLSLIQSVSKELVSDVDKPFNISESEQTVGLCYTAKALVLSICKYDTLFEVDFLMVSLTVFMCMIKGNESDVAYTDLSYKPKR